jgi:hypothetical protein
MFQGWHMVVWAHLFELVLVLAIAGYALWRLFRRAMQL